MKTVVTGSSDQSNESETTLVTSQKQTKSLSRNLQDEQGLIPEFSASDYTGSSRTEQPSIRKESSTDSEQKSGLSLDWKHTNPKDMVGSGKLPMELVPDTIEAEVALAFLEGALKYGRFNWRISGVRASIYRAALRRHLARWWNGEDKDKITGIKHLASIIACAGIILDADLCGKLVDDRPPRAPVGKIIDVEPHIEHLKQLFKSYSPKQYTIEDGVEDEGNLSDRFAQKSPGTGGGENAA